MIDISPIEDVDKMEKSLSPFSTKEDSLKNISLRIPSVFETTLYDFFASMTDVAG